VPKVCPFINPVCYGVLLKTLWKMRRYKMLAIVTTVLLFITLWYHNSVNLHIPFAQLVDYFGLPSTLYIRNVSCSGCNQFSTLYLIKPRQTAYCTHDKPIFLMVLAVSRPNNFDQRLAVRRSWGSISAHRERSIRTYFVFGRTANSRIQSALENEATRWNDILQVWYQIFAYKVWYQIFAYKATYTSCSNTTLSFLVRAVTYKTPLLPLPS